jgi:hypothetical protein
MCIRAQNIYDIIIGTWRSCKRHYARKVMTQKIFQVGIWWPTIHKDVKEFCQTRDVCWRVIKTYRRDNMPLILQDIISTIFFPNLLWRFIKVIRPISNKLKVEFEFPECWHSGKPRFNARTTHQQNTNYRPFLQHLWSRWSLTQGRGRGSCRTQVSTTKLGHRSVITILNRELKQQYALVLESHSHRR